MDTLNTGIPEIPLAIFSVASDDPDLTFHLRCEELWIEVMEELRDERFLKRAHMNSGTYDLGCRGPLCRKSRREHVKRKSPGGNLPIIVREERIYDPVLEYFHTVMKYRIKNFQRKILEEIA